MLEDGDFFDKLEAVGTDALGPVGSRGTGEGHGDGADLGWLGEVESQKRSELRGGSVQVDGAASSTSIVASGRLTAQEDDRL